MDIQTKALRDYFARNGIMQKDVCEATGLASATLSNVLSGRFGISKKLAQKLAQIYGFNVSFLLSGEGDLINEKPAPRPADENTLRAEVAQLRKELDREREEKARLLGIIETLTK